MQCDESPKQAGRRESRGEGLGRPRGAETTAIVGWAIPGAASRGATLSDARIRLGSSAEPGAGPLRLCLCFYSPNCNNPDVGCRQSWLASKSYLSCHLAAPGHLDEKPLVSFLLSRCGRPSRRRHHHDEGGRRGGGVRRRRGLSPISIYLSVRPSVVGDTSQHMTHVSGLVCRPRRQS